MGPIEADLDAQIEFLQLPTTRWIPHFPINVNEACAVIRVKEKYKVLKLTEATRQFLDDFIITCGETYTFFEEKNIFSSIICFNDWQTSVEPVIQMLEKVRAKAAEEEL
jgi:hypothetical protein